MYNQCKSLIAITSVRFVHCLIQSQIHLPAANFLIGWCLCQQMMLRKSLVYALDAFRAKFVQTYACWFSLWRICNPWMIKIPLWASITKTLMGGEAFVRGGISMLSSSVLMYPYSVLYYCTIFPELSGNLNPGLSVSQTREVPQFYSTVTLGGVKM